jgi:FG-GAP-like repeat
VSNTELKATIRAAEIAKAKTGRVTVQNPAPGGGLSPAAFLPVREPAATVNFTLEPVKNSTTVFPQNDQLLTQATDVNNDGHLDLIWTPNSNDSTGTPAQTVNVQLGKHDGKFQPPIATAALQGVFVVGYGDFNGDGNVDLLVENGSISQQEPHYLAIMLGNGDGTFQAPQQIADPATVPSAVDYPISQGSVAVADVNGDGKLDVIYTNIYTVMGVTVLFGNGDGTFTAGGQFGTDSVAMQIGLADLNQDGKLDLVLAGAQPFDDGETRSVVEVYLGNGTFGAGLVVPGTQKDTTGSAEPANFAVADFNGDTIPDLVYFSPEQAEIYLGNGDGTFAAPLAMPVSSTSPVTFLGDFNGDGKLDLLTEFGVLLLGNGDGTFSVGFNMENLVSNPSIPFVDVIGDFNDDGEIDAATVVGKVVIKNNIDTPTDTINIIQQVAP